MHSKRRDITRERETIEVENERETTIAIAIVGRASKKRSKTEIVWRAKFRYFLNNWIYTSISITLA